MSARRLLRSWGAHRGRSRAGGLIVVLGVGWAVAAGAQAPGDVDCDGRVTAADAYVMVSGIFGYRPFCAALDVNRDGGPTGADLVGVVRVMGAVPPEGPRIVHFGLAGANGVPIGPFAHLGDTPIFLRTSGAGFKIVVEAAPGPNGALPGRVTAHLEDPTRVPDLQIGCARPLGDGSPAVCVGGVAPLAPPHFDASDATHRSFNDFGCPFESFTAAPSSCTVDGFGNAAFQHAATRLQLCAQVPRDREFPVGDTLCSVRVRDVGGTLGPLASIIVRVGADPSPPTFTPTQAPTVTNVPPTWTPSPTSTPTVLGPTAAPTTRVPSPSPTTTRSPTPATPTGTSAPSTVPTVTVTPSATRPGTSTNTPTRSPTTPIAMTATRSMTPSRTPTRTATASLTPTATASATRTRTPTATPTPTPTGLRGPIVSHFGLARVDENPISPSGQTPTGIPIYTRASDWGFRIVVEGRPGSSGLAPGNSAFTFGGSAFSDIQILSSRPLGNGSPAVCDRQRPNAGGVPAVEPPVFADTSFVIGAANDLSCRFLDGVGNAIGRQSSGDSCVQVPANSSTFRFVSSTSTIQFCSLVDSAFAFPEGDTVLTVRLRDVAGNVGVPAQIVVRVVPTF